jgi:glycosyltransferase involved in cell wall biosynthesis
MNILVLTTKYCHPDGSPWLVSELVEQLNKSGHKITVLNVDWNGFSHVPLNLPEDIIFVNFSAIRIGSGKFSLLIRWLFSSFKIVPFLILNLLFKKKFDLLISFSPCLALYSALPVAQIISKESILIYWDFFPIHHNEASRKIPSLFIPLIKSIERYLIRGFRRVSLMSDANLIFFKKYFGENLKVLTEVIPIWTSVTNWKSSEDIISTRAKFKIDPQAVVFVFGGQLVSGRGISKLCQSIISAHYRNKNINLVICGSGPLESTVLDFVKIAPSAIKFFGSLQRLDYLNFIYACDVGVVITIADVSVPTFPSKCLDYFACKLPILAAVEVNSDFGTIVSKNEIGISCLVDSIDSISEGLLFFANHTSEIKRMGKNANNYIKSTHNVENLTFNITGDKNV